MSKIQRIRYKDMDNKSWVELRMLLPKKGKFNRNGRVEYTIGLNGIIITSTAASWGSIPIGGLRNIRKLRDFCSEVCRINNIK